MCKIRAGEMKNSLLNSLRQGISVLLRVGFSGKKDLTGSGSCECGRSSASRLEPCCNLIQSLLNAVQFHLSCLCELLDALRGSLQMVCHVAYDLAATVAEEEHAESSQQHSQAA